MTDQDSGQSENTAQIDHEAEFVRIRQRISGLGESIRDLNASADELIRSADSRTALAVMEPPPEVVEDGLERLESSIAALGRHAANLPEEFDPTPLEADDPDYPGDSSASFASADASPIDHDEGASGDAGESAFGDLSELQDVGRVDGDGATDHSAEAPGLGEPAAASGADSVTDGSASEDGAQVLEFVPRRGRPSPAEGQEPAFGEMADQIREWTPPRDPEEPRDPEDETPLDQRPPPPPEDELAFGAPEPHPSAGVEDGSELEAGSADDDGLDKIAETESTDVAHQWDNVAQDDDAFDKFFSNEVEPEPAQRWLLNE